MLNMPPLEIKKKIAEQTSLSATDIDGKVKQKMAQLSGLVSEEGACHIVANELSVDLIPKAGDRSVKDLLPGMRDISQDLKVIQVYELRTFESKFEGSQGKVCSFLAGDNSGVIRVTCWSSLADPASKLKKDDIVQIKNAYVKDNRGRAELHLNDKSTIEINPEGVSITVSQSQSDEEYVRKKVKDITRGDYRIELVGTIVQVYEPRFFERKDGSGRGAVMNSMIDDGSGNIRCALWGETAAKALGIDEKTLLANGEQPYDEERTALLGTIVIVQGRAKLNETYNSIDMSVDVLDLEPDAGKELKDTPAVEVKEEPIAVAPAPTATIKETPKAPEPVAMAQEAPEPIAETPEAPVEKPKPSPEPISLDELEDLDLDDI